MKTWNDLDHDERKKAVDKATELVLEVVIEGSVRFNDELNGDNLQQNIDSAIEAANKNRTPWFAGEYVYDAVGDQLRNMGQSDAEEAYYPEKNEMIIRL